jgi:hypothetical protein
MMSAPHLSQRRTFDKFKKFSRKRLAAMAAYRRMTTAGKGAGATLISILSQKKYFLTAVVVFLIFVFMYLSATEFLFLTERPEAAERFFAVKVSENWQELIFRQRAPFLFEPIGALDAGRLKLFISLPNIFLASLLGVLAASNLAVSHYRFNRLGLKGGKGAFSLLGTLPAFLSGAACCVPTLVLVIGLQFTAIMAAIWPFFVPFSFVLLIFALWWSLVTIEKSENYIIYD